MDFANFWFTDPAGGGVNPDMIPGSVRLRRNSAAIVRTGAPNNPNSKKWTYSGWYKNGDSNDSGQGVLWGCAPASTLYGRIEIRGTKASGEVYMTNNHSSGGGQAWNCRCSARLRDPTAWYHLVVVYDSAQSTSSNRIKFYINGVQYGSDNNSYPGQNVGGLLNGGYKDAVGRGQGAFNSWCAEGYMAEVRVCDNATYDASYFGEYDDNGMWVPKSPADINVNYGNAGFYLPMTAGAVQTNAAGTSAAFTAENIEQSNPSSLDYDCMLDSPSNNTHTWNAVFNTNQSNGNSQGRLNLANANHRATQGGNLSRGGYSTGALFPGGKYYWEADQGSSYGGQSGCATTIGFGVPRSTFGISTDIRQWIWYGLYWKGTGRGGSANKTAELLWNGSVQSTISLSNDWQPGRIAGIAIDTTTSSNNVKLYVNGALVGTGSFNFAGLPAEAKMQQIYTAIHSQPNQYCYLNAGQYAWRYTPPADHKAPSTGNLAKAVLPDTITGSFGGNNNADGPYVYTGCIPGRIQYGSVNVTFGNRFGQSDVDFLSNGFKIRSTNSNSGTVSYTVTTTHSDGEYNGKKVPFGGKGSSPANGIAN